MSSGAVNFSNNNEWFTPKEIVDIFGQFEYDPATTEEKAKEFNIPNYDTIETDGLKSEWGGYKTIWINPPFTMKQLFFEKACKTYKESGNDIYFLAPISFLTTQKFHNICKKYDCGVKLFLPNGRIKFHVGQGNKASSPAFGSVVMRIENEFLLEPINIKEVE